MEQTVPEKLDSDRIGLVLCVIVQYFKTSYLRKTAPDTLKDVPYARGDPSLP